MMRKCMVALMCVIAVVGVIGCFGGSGSGSSGPMTLIPSNVTAVGEVNMAQLITIKAIKAQIDDQQSSPEAEEMKKYGVTPETVKKIAFGVDVTKMSDTNMEPDFVVAIEYAGEVKKEELKKHFAEQSGGKAKLEFVGTNMAVLGSPAAVDAAVKLGAGTGESVAKNAALMGVCKERSGLVWAGAIVPAEKLKALGGGAPVKPDQVKDLFIKADYAEATGIKAAVKITAASEDAAKEMKTQLEQGKAMLAMLQIPAEAVTIAQTGAVIDITIALSKELLDKFAAMSEQK